jgi:hypothetical protein
MSINVLYSSSVQKIVDGVKTVDEEFVIKGEKGLKVKYYNVRGDKKEKIVITGKDGEYKMKKTSNGEVTESDLDSDGLKSELKSPKLKFASSYLKSSDKKGGSKSKRLTV